MLFERIDQAMANNFHAILFCTGIDTARYYVTSLEGFDMYQPELVTPAEHANTAYTALIDVRSKLEYMVGSYSAWKRRTAEPEWLC